MAEVSANPTPGKRSLQDLEPILSDEAPMSKRACLEATRPASAHLSLLEEELCDLEGEGAESSSLQPIVTDVTSQEDLVAEMMKSLEKVIEEGESRGAGDASTSYPSSEATSPVHNTSSLGLNWTSDGYPAADDDESSFHGELQYEDDFNGDARIQHVLQASDDDLGITSSSDLEDSSFHEEWASLADETGPAAVYSLNWLDGPYQIFEEARDLYEPAILF